MTTFIPHTDQPLTQPQRSAGAEAAGLTFISATAVDPATSRRSARAVTITDEVRECFQALDLALNQAGLTRADLFKTRCWVTDDEHRAEFLTAYKNECEDDVYPQRITMRAGLPGGCRVAIEAIASRA